MRRYIMHLDMDAFFASVEQADNPELKGKAVIIGGSHRGVVSAASYEARVFGVRSAMPMAQARKLCPAGVFLPVRMSRYREVSRQVMSMITECSPLVEKASIDEAYADLTGTETMHGSPVRLAALLKADIRDATSLTCSIGIAPVKFLAKISSDYRKPDGLTFLDEEDVPAFLSRLPVTKIPGVGEKAAQSLSRLGIRMASDILKLPRSYWEERFGKYGLFLHDRAQGIDPSEVVPWSEPKSCSTENTFHEDIDDPEELRKWLLHQAERVGRELREDGYVGRTVVLKLKFADFTQITRSRTLPEPTNITKVIFEEAARLLACVRLTSKVRLIGVGLSGLARGSRQLPLCPDGQTERQALLDRTMDEVRRKFGDPALTRGPLLGFKK